MISIWNLQKIRDAREAKDLNVKTAAEQLNIRAEYLSMLENGHRQPSQKLIARMSVLYSQPPTYFLNTEKNLALP